ncbi:hypothetical protein ACJIZ3_006018 [Penstemon smallii]|uniref:Uncharacterized protein n=1 Tax=Penstemon smallii TaxID=265156 RepID=A0ABD3S6N8_9LAMI
MEGMIPLPTVDEKKKVVEDVKKDRRYNVDPSLLDIKLIKKMIEDLITRDYLERDEKNPKTFKYLARFR